MIETRGLHKIYQMGSIQVRALDGIDLSIDKGEFVGIMGPSGSGKTTLLHMLGLLDVPTSGEIILDGQHRIATWHLLSIASDRINANVHWRIERAEIR